jgi:hypothetical protein
LFNVDGELQEEGERVRDARLCSGEEGGCSCKFVKLRKKVKKVITQGRNGVVVVVRGLGAGQGQKRKIIFIQGETLHGNNHPNMTDPNSTTG